MPNTNGQKNPFEVALLHCCDCCDCTCPADGEVVGEAEVCPSAGRGCVVDLLIETYDVLKQINSIAAFSQFHQEETDINLASFLACQDLQHARLGD